MKKILGFLLAMGCVGSARAIQVNTAAAVIADSANTPETAVYRDTSGFFYPPMPAVETVAAAATITANACGGVKKITSVGPQTTNTTNTFTSTTSLSNLPCVMDLINVSTVSITLDHNLRFQGLASADVVMTASDTLRVAGTDLGWISIGGIGAN